MPEGGGEQGVLALCPDTFFLECGERERLGEKLNLEGSTRPEKTLLCPQLHSLHAPRPPQMEDM